MVPRSWQAPGPIRLASDTWYVMTAGHCFPAGDTASQNNSDSNLLAYTSSKSIGSVGATPYGPGRSTNCDCEALGPIAASQVSRQAFVNGEKTYTFNNVANQQGDYKSSPQACEDGVTEYPTYHGIICGKVDNPSVRMTYVIPGGRYTITDMFHVAYFSGAHPLNGDSGGPVGSGPTCLD